MGSDTIVEMGSDLRLKVREEGVEPSRVTPHASETCAYAIPPLPQKSP